MDGPKVPRFLGRKRFNFRFVQFAFNGSAFVRPATPRQVPRGSPVCRRRRRWRRGVRSIDFGPDAWEDFVFWLASDRKTARRIVRLIAEIQRDPFSGIGKPEPLKGELSGDRS
jgi:YoeB-like toxin of bacterial type II toxin-antitoxin system